MERKGLKKYSDKNLKKEFEAQKQQVEDIGCFGVKDVIYLDWLEYEMASRGFL